MFVSVVLDPGGIDSAKAISQILVRFGFKKVQRACWENFNISENQLSILKRYLDNETDYYDTLRIYQFPINGNFAITQMDKKKWKKAIFQGVTLDFHSGEKQDALKKIGVENDSIED
ncbi:CRISPR-associated protein Cas2 [Treponema pectinovorum]|uniref:CRISPR-associated protein Cas2 n=1 Tax=Treponema pectinovorum TaxID=164 RepID=UPI001FEC2680|nr:CRISPR-associated protein Cas2 [Treponema pectinovorum]